jgi:3-deoxy-D-manno-octulosonic-acid transferase
MARRAYHSLSRLVVHLPVPPGGLRRSLRGRATARERWIRWAADQPDSSPVVWVHGASVGELLTARPVVQRLRTLEPGPIVACSYSSPSAADWRRFAWADHADFLPLDTPEHVGAVLDAVRPAAIVLARGDLWPEFLGQAYQRRIPVTIIGASIRPGSRRLHRPFRTLYANVVEGVSWIGAATRRDMERWRLLGARESTIELSGDPRHDDVLERTTQCGPVRALETWARDRSVLVAGSIEGGDERPLCTAIHAVLSQRERARVLLVPHDPSPRILDRLHGRLARTGVRSARWIPAEGTVPDSSCILVAATGILNDLYALGGIAYVGGGFRRGTLHAVIEPAAFGVPILTGPHTDVSPDAQTLAAAGGLVAVSTARDLAARWLGWMDDEAARVAAGLAARRCLVAGAAAISADVIGGWTDRRMDGSNIE